MDLIPLPDRAANIVLVSSSDTHISEVQDALDLLASASYTYDSRLLILERACLDDAFYRLRTGLAGEILQKFVNYGVHAVILGDFSEERSASLRDFIRESNRGPHIRFIADLPSAIAWLSGKD